MKKGLQLVFAILFLTMCTSVAGFVAPAGADTGKRVILIFDASGSMWGQIDGTPKIVTAKEVMSDLVKDLPSSLAVGLTVYGHRHEGDCNDVEEVLPLAPLDRDQFISRIRALKPKGKTPIAHSISLVAEKLKAMDGGGTIILVSDGEETCGGDPCKLVADLKAAGVEFVMHVVGFDVKGPVSEQLACIAKAGGGTYAEAGDSARLKAALTGVIQQTLAENLVVRAVQTSQKKKSPTAIDAVVTVFKDGTQVAEGSGSRVGFKLEPGTYDLDVSIPDLGQSKKLEKIAVTAAAKTEKEVAFTISTLGAVARDSEGKVIEVYLKISAQGSKTPAADGWSGSKTPRLFPLPPGTYSMMLSEEASGQQAVLDNVVLPEGEEVIKEASFGLAKLAVTAKDSQGKPMDVYLQVFKQDDEEKRVADGGTGTEAPRYLDLPPGVYSVKVRDNASKQETWLRDVTLAPGAKVVKEVSFSVARLAVTAKDSQGKPIDVYLRVFKQGDDENQVADWGTGTGEPRYRDLPPGVYSVKVRDNASKQETWLRDVTLEPGAKVVKEVSFSVARLAVTAKDSQGKPMDVYLRVFKQGDDENQVADWGTGTGEPRYRDLPPAVYSIKVRDNASKQETWLRDVTLEPGAKVVKEVSFSVARLAVTAKDSQGKPMDVYLRVFKQGDDENQVADWGTGTGEPRYRDLPPAVYSIKVRDNASKQETWLRDVTLEPGAKVVKEVSFSVARLAVTAKDSQGKPMDVYLRVFKQGDEEKQVADWGTGTGEPRYRDLPPAVYSVKVRDNASKQETWLRDVTLEPGAKVVKEVSFSVARLAVTARNSQGKPIDVYLRVFKQDDEEKQVADGGTGTGEPRYRDLPPGVYSIKVRDNASKQETWLRDVTLAPGAKVVKEVSF